MQQIIFTAHQLDLFHTPTFKAAKSIWRRPFCFINEANNGWKKYQKS